MSPRFGLISALQFALIGAQWKSIVGSTASAGFTSLFTLSVFMTCCLYRIHAKVLPEIYWNSTNPIFRIDNTEHVFVVRINDRVDFICPYYASASSMDQADAEVMEIYSVSKWAYDYCALSPDAVLAGVCNNPFQRTYATIVFREYTPKPGGLEFKPGRSYYFISASTGQLSGLQNKHGGLCSAKNMKVKFEVEPHGSSGAVPSRSVDGLAAAGGNFAQTNFPPKDQDGDDEQGDITEESDQNGAEKAGDETNGNDQNGNSEIGVDATTPRLYEIHTRPENEIVPVKRPDDAENYGANAHQRRNSSPKSYSCQILLYSSVLCSAFLPRLVDYLRFI